MSTSKIINFIPDNWKSILNYIVESERFTTLLDWIENQMSIQTVYPPVTEMFSTYQILPIHLIKVVILGQDPYHGNNQAHGLSFSVKKGEKQPPSLRNIFKELASDLNISVPDKNMGDLTQWAKQGVFLLNAVLSVTEGQPNSHKKKGWEEFTNATIKAISDTNSNVVFILWGAFAQKKTSLIDSSKHLIIASSHPSPLGAYRGFWGSKPFSKTNNYLIQTNQKPINWEIK